jgi:hypothetical protein
MVQDARVVCGPDLGAGRLNSGVQLAFIPVYNPQDEGNRDTMASTKAFPENNYAISAKIERFSTGGRLVKIHKWVKGNASCGHFKTSGTL